MGGGKGVFLTLDEISISQCLEFDVRNGSLIGDDRLSIS